MSSASGNKIVEKLYHFLLYLQITNITMKVFQRFVIIFKIVSYSIKCVPWTISFRNCCYFQTDRVV